MRLRALVAAAALAGSGIAVGSAPAALAYCDPKYYPLCTNDCHNQPPPKNVKEVRDWLFRVCPD